MATPEQLLAARIDGRRTAEQIIELGDEAAAALDSPAAIAAFFERFSKWIEPHVKREPTAPTFEPMGSVEAAAFRCASMPFGKYAAVPLAEVPADYLAWLVDQRDDFIKDLRRYVRSQVVQQELEQQDRE